MSEPDRLVTFSLDDHLFGIDVRCGEPLATPHGLEQMRRAFDAVFVAVTSTAASFSLQFAGCNPQGRACRRSGRRSPT